MTREEITDIMVELHIMKGKAINSLAKGGEINGDIEQQALYYVLSDKPICMPTPTATIYHNTINSYYYLWKIEEV